MCPKRNLISVGLLEEDQLSLSYSTYFLSIFLLVGIDDSSLSGFVLQFGASFHGSMVEFWESTSHKVFQIMCNNRIASFVVLPHWVTFSTCEGSLALKNVLFVAVFFFFFPALTRELEASPKLLSSVDCL